MSEPEKYAYDMLSAEIRVLIMDIMTAATHPITPFQAVAFGDKVLKAMTTAFKLGHVQGRIDMEKAFMESVPKLAEKILASFKAREKEIDEQGPGTNTGV